MITASGRLTICNLSHSDMKNVMTGHEQMSAPLFRALFYIIQNREYPSEPLRIIDEIVPDETRLTGKLRSHFTVRTDHTGAPTVKESKIPPWETGPL